MFKSTKILNIRYVNRMMTDPLHFINKYKLNHIIKMKKVSHTKRHIKVHMDMDMNSDWKAVSPRKVASIQSLCILPT